MGLVTVFGPHNNRYLLVKICSRHNYKSKYAKMIYVHILLNVVGNKDKWLHLCLKNYSYVILDLLIYKKKTIVQILVRIKS